ncbi:hypothetical protein HW555_002795, partial [Spodoptera exigua]
CYCCGLHVMPKRSDNRQVGAGSGQAARVLVEAGSHGRDLSDACDLQKYPRIKRPPGATYKGRARHRAVLLSNLATTTGTSCAACLLCRAPSLRAAPALSHHSPQRPPIGNGYYFEKQKKKSLCIGNYVPYNKCQLKY